MKTASQYEEEWMELVTIRLGDRNAPLNPVGTLRWIRSERSGTGTEHSWKESFPPTIRRPSRWESNVAAYPMFTGTMPQKFSSISKGELKKFDGRNARIVTRASGIEATGQIFVRWEMVIFLSDDTELQEDLDRADFIKDPYNDGFDLYYEDDIDETVRTNLVKEIEIS